MKQPRNSDRPIYAKYLGQTILKCKIYAGQITTPPDFAKFLLEAAKLNKSENNERHEAAYEYRTRPHPVAT